MTYLNYDVFDKVIVIDLLFKKLEKRLAHAGSKWNANQIFKVKCYAQDARDYFKDILLQSLNTTQDYRVDPSCYPHITQVYPSFTQELGDPFLDICLLPNSDYDTAVTAAGPAITDGRSSSVFELDSEAAPAHAASGGGLDSVEKLVCLILFSEHIIAYCDSRWEEVDTSDVDYLALVNGILEDEEGAADSYDAGARDIEPLFEDKLTLNLVTGKTVERGGVVVDVNDLLEMIGMA